MSNHTDTIRTVRRRINDIRNPTYLVEKKHQEAKPKDHNFIHSGEEKSPLQVRQIHDKVENDEDTAGEDVKLERTKGESEEANLKRRGNMSRSGPYDGKDFGNDEAYVWESPKKSIDKKIDSLKVSHLYSYEIRKQGQEQANPDTHGIDTTMMDNYYKIKNDIEYHFEKGRQELDAGTSDGGRWNNDLQLLLEKQKVTIEGLLPWLRAEMNKQQVSSSKVE